MAYYFLFILVPHRKWRTTRRKWGSKTRKWGFGTKWYLFL